MPLFFIDNSYDISYYLFFVCYEKSFPVNFIKVIEDKRIIGSIE